MISDSIVKQAFITEIANEEFARLRTEQISRLEGKRGTLTKKHFNVDELISDVRNRQMNVMPTNSGITFQFEVLKKLRFADMKKLGNAKVYNKPLWGIIFGEKYSMLTRLKYEFTEETRDKIFEQIKQNLKNEESNINL
jgi:hypothetical protein